MKIESNHLLKPLQTDIMELKRYISQRIYTFEGDPENLNDLLVNYAYQIQSEKKAKESN